MLLYILLNFKFIIRVCPLFKQEQKIKNNVKNKEQINIDSPIHEIMCVVDSEKEQILVA